MESLTEEAGRRPCSPAEGAQDAAASASLRRDCTRGPLISVDGVTGVGKTYLTGRAAEGLDGKPLFLDGFSDRKREQPGLGEALLAALRRASGKDPFLRGGTPMAETLLLLAIKRHDLDTVIPDLAAGRTVIEGRSVDSTAVCQALLLHPSDPDAAIDEAVALLGLAASFRQLPDLTVLITDDASAAIDRAQRRDKRNYTPEQATFMREASALFERVAATDPARYRVIDRRSADEHEATGQIRAWIGGATAGLACIREPWQDPGAPCICCGHRPGQEPG